MDPQHHKALEAVLAQSPTDKTPVVPPPPPPSTSNDRPPLQRRPSLDGGAARQAAADVAAVEATAERIAQERGYASTTDTLRLVSRLLAQDETICRCRGSEVSGGGTTRQGANERFRVRVESRQAAAQMLEAIQLRTAKQQAAASPQVVRKAPTVTSPVPQKKRSLSHKLLKSKLQGSMAKAAFSSGGKAQATKRFEKHLGARLDAPSCENVPGLENGSSVLCWKNREWVPGHVKAFRERGELDNEEDEVLIAELGKDDTSWKWIPTSSPRLLRMDVHPDFRVANRRRGDFVKEGERVVSAWAPRDEREFWSRRNKGIGPAGTVRRVVPARDAAEVELDGLCCTERYWLPLHALEKASSENEGADVLAVRDEALDRVRRALARIEPRNPPYACVRVVKGRRCIVRLSYEDDAKGAEPEDLRWKIHVRVCGRTRRGEAQELSDALLRDREKARKATSSAMKRGGARDALARRRSSRKARKDDAEAFKAFGTRRLLSPERPASRENSVSRPSSRNTSRPQSRETSRPSSAVPSQDGSLEPERSPSDWAAPNHLQRDLPSSYIRALGFDDYMNGDAAWSARARASLCEAVADTVDVRRGQLVLNGLQDAIDEESEWSCDVDCFVRDVPCRLRFTSCDQELRCVLAWCDRHVPERRGSHSYSLQMSDWRLLGYGSRLEWLTDNERAKLCRALALRLETRHGVPVLCVHPSDRLVWPTAVSWCALPHDGVDLPSDKDRIPRTKGSDWRLRGVTSRAFANNNLMLWRSVVKLACGTACSRDFKEDPAGRVGLERWLASARRIGGRIELEARHVPTGASARCVTDIGSWFSLGQLRAPLQWLSRDQQRGVASRLVELGLADPTTSRLRQKVDQCVGAEPRRHESDDEPKPVRKTRVEREALRRVRKERRRLKKQLSKPVSIQKALRIDDDLAQSTVGTRRSEAQDTIGPRRSEATAPSRASRIVEVNEPQAIVDVPPQTTPHATPHGSPRGTLAILDEQTVQTLQTESLASPSVLTLQTDISPLKEDSLHNQGSVQTLQAASLITTASERVELAELPSDDSDGESWGAKPPSDDEGDDDELGVAERHRNDASELIEDAMQPGVQSKQQHRVFLEREKGLLELFSTRKAKKLLKGGTTETAQGKLTVAVAAGLAVRRERKDAQHVLLREQAAYAACKPCIGRAQFLRDVRIQEVRYGTPEARQAHKDGREANDMRTEASRLRREVLDLGRALIAIHDQAEVLWTRIQDLAPPAAGWWVSAFKLLDPDSPEAKVSSEETTTLAVLTRRPFPKFSELQLWEDGVSTMSRHRDAVDGAVRASTRLAREPRQFRDGMIPRRRRGTPMIWERKYDRACPTKRVVGGSACRSSARSVRAALNH